MARPSISDFDKRLRFVISSNLTRLMGGMTQSALSEITGIPASTISGYIARRSTPSPDQVQKLADALMVNKSEIDPRFGLNTSAPISSECIAQTVEIMRGLNDEGQQIIRNTATGLHQSGRYNRPKADVIDLSEAIGTYTIGSAAAGNGYEYGDHDENYRLFMSETLPDCDFSIDVKGDSMQPTLYDGDVAFVAKNCDRIDRQIYVLDVDGATVIKRVVFEQEQLTLISDNPDWEDRIVAGDELENTRLLGKVVGWETPVR